MYTDVISWFASRNFQKFKKPMKLVNIEEENLQWNNQFWGKMCLAVKVKTTGFTHAPENTVLWRPQGSVKLSPTANLSSKKYS